MNVKIFFDITIFRLLIVFLLQYFFKAYPAIHYIFFAVVSTSLRPLQKKDAVSIRAIEPPRLNFLWKLIHPSKGGEFCALKYCEKIVLLFKKNGKQNTFRCFHKLLFKLLMNVRN